MKADQFKIQWIDSHKEPSCEPNPDYPEGIDLDVTVSNAPKCKALLPYPAKRIGYYIIECRLCSLRAACTTAGRPDDPRSMTFPCKFQ